MENAGSAILTIKDVAAVVDPSSLSHPPPSELKTMLVCCPAGGGHGTTNA